MTRRRDLISPLYLMQNQILHKSKDGFGGSGWKHTDAILKFADACGPVRTMLDYGAGESTLQKSFKKRGVKIKLAEYDPAIPRIANMPDPSEMVVCTDVLEHIEPEFIDRVLQHIYELTKVCAYLVIATRPANKKLPDGRNAHLILEDATWWHELILRGRPDWRMVEFSDIRRGKKVDGANYEVRAWLRK